MARPDALGQFEQLVLTAVLTQREDAYGVTIHAKLQELARPREVSLGAVYVTLDRLEWRELQHRLRAGGFGFGLGDPLEYDLEGHDRPLGVERFERLWM